MRVATKPDRLDALDLDPDRPADWERLTSEELVERLREAGVWDGLPVSRVFQQDVDRLLEDLPPSFLINPLNSLST